MKRLLRDSGDLAQAHYACLKGPGKKALSDRELDVVMSRLQDEHGYSLSYRQMAVIVSRETGKKVNRKRVLRVMREEGLLSSVRRRYSEEVCAERRKLKGAVIPDLIRRGFCAMEPGRRFVEDITYLPSLEWTMYLNSKWTSTTPR